MIVNLDLIRVGDGVVVESVSVAAENVCTEVYTDTPKNTIFIVVK
jgi:hypothetical protein